VTGSGPLRELPGGGGWIAPDGDGPLSQLADTPDDLDDDPQPDDGRPS
jgi:hypothetical protein